VEAIGETATRAAVAYREDRSSPSARCGSNRKGGEEGKELANRAEGKTTRNSRVVAVLVFFSVAYLVAAQNWITAISPRPRAREREREREHVKSRLKFPDSKNTGRCIAEPKRRNRAKGTLSRMTLTRREKRSSRKTDGRWTMSIFSPTKLCFQRCTN